MTSIRKNRIQQAQRLPEYRSTELPGGKLRSRHNARRHGLATHIEDDFEQSREYSRA